MKVTFTCAACGQTAERETGQINRSRRAGAPLYCGKACYTSTRRSTLSTDERCAAKSAYDRQRRTVLGEALLVKKRQAYRDALERDRGAVREAQKRLRKKRKNHHLEYCRTPAYRKWKAEYDKAHRARKFYGPFGEAAIILNDIKTEIRSRASWTEIRSANKTLNKCNERKRDYACKTGYDPVRS